jgi:hypothetical protein
MTTIPRFTKRRNIDSSIDSICTKCFQTIASAGSEEELAEHEEKHFCDPHVEFTNMWFDMWFGPESRAHGVSRPPAPIQAS